VEKPSLGLYSMEPVEAVIVTVRRQKVILDADLARMYGVPTKALNQAVKRNRDKFPEDFIFQLTDEEAAELRCSRSQFVTLKRGQIGFVVKERRAVYRVSRK